MDVEHVTFTRYRSLLEDTGTLNIVTVKTIISNTPVYTHLFHMLRKRFAHSNHTIDTPWNQSQDHEAMETVQSLDSEHWLIYNVNVQARMTILSFKILWIAYDLYPHLHISLSRRSAAEHRESPRPLPMWSIKSGIEARIKACVQEAWCAA